MSLEIKNISKKYKTQIALSNICFSLKKGDIVGFLGPNGAGKTTLMKIITSTLQQDMGSVSINGFDTIENELDTKAQIGYLAENNPLYNEMYVTEYLDFIASIYNLSDKQREKFGIKKYGVIVQNISGDPAQEAGLLKNDIIYQISGENIQNIEQLNRIIKSMKKGDFASLLVRRSQNNSLYLAIQIE